MAKTWVAQYKGHAIEIENNWRGEKLTVDGVVQDETCGLVARATLWGEIPSGDGAGEEIKAQLGAVFTVQCRLFIANRAVALERQK